MYLFGLSHRLQYPRIIIPSLQDKLCPLLPDPVEFHQLHAACLFRKMFMKRSVVQNEAKHDDGTAKAVSAIRRLPKS